MRIAVIGLGRIGSRILRELWVRFPATLGVDCDPEKVEKLRAEGLPAAVDPQEAAGADVYLMAVSTGPRMEGLFAAAAG
ncbi:MAG: nucleotide sugar dehydrogenase, partial [Firmicutes bacterium]|nr:nucleotide sugar dehydrogenase [Bacillota bacterium]